MCREIVYRGEVSERGFSVGLRSWRGRGGYVFSCVCVVSLEFRYLLSVPKLRLQRTRFVRG